LPGTLTAIHFPSCCPTPSRSSRQSAWGAGSIFHSLTRTNWRHRMSCSYPASGLHTGHRAAFSTSSSTNRKHVARKASAPTRSAGSPPDPEPWRASRGCVRSERYLCWQWTSARYDSFLCLFSL